MAKLLYSLKEWLTIPAAAAHLTTCFGEEVTEADVLQLGLDEHLELSVKLLNPIVAWPGGVEPADPDRLQSQWNLRIGRKLLLVFADPDDLNLASDEERAKFLGNGVVSAFVESEKVRIRMEGVWNLPMVGDERLAVEQRLRLINGGPTVSRSDAGSGCTFVNRSDGLWCALLRPLPEDAVLVVRTTALDDLKARVGELSPKGGKPSAMDKPLRERERLTLLRIIRALAKEANVDISKTSKAGVTISAMTELLGDPVAPRTVAGHLKKIKEELS